MDRLCNLDDAVHENTGCNDMLRIDAAAINQSSLLRPCTSAD
jgi:hypothetical protein